MIAVGKDIFVTRELYDKQHICKHFVHDSWLQNKLSSSCRPIYNMTRKQNTALNEVTRGHSQVLQC